MRLDYKVIIVGLLILIVVAVVFYALGLRQGRGELEIQKANYQKQIQQLQQTLNVSDNRNRLLQARIGLYRAAADLDQRNFGFANTHFQEASAALLSVDPAAVGVDPAQLNKLKQDISGTNIQMTMNLEDQRARVLTLASQIDNLMPPQMGGSPAIPAQAPPPQTAPAPAAPPGAGTPPAK